MEELQAFQFRVGHRARVHYNNADNLHRRPFATAGRRYCEWRETRERELLEEEKEEDCVRNLFFDTLQSRNSIRAVCNSISKEMTSLHFPFLLRCCPQFHHA